MGRKSSRLAVTSQTAPRVKLSGAARRFAAENGGVLYLWVEQQSGRRHGWLIAATEQPGGIGFGPVTDVDGIRVHLQSGMRAVLSRPVTVRLWRFPRVHLDVNGAVVVDPA